MPSKQETFNTVVAHLRKQGRKAVTDDGCAYRGDDGTKCAAGCLIPDEDYRPEFENTAVVPQPEFRKSASSIAIAGVLEKHGHDLRLVEELQYIHDDCDVDEWEWQFGSLADKHGLTYTPPQSPEPVKP